MNKYLNCEIDADLFKEFKIVLASQEKTITDVINILVREYVIENSSSNRS